MTAPKNNLDCLYPAVDLSDPDVVKAQIDNAFRFKPKWRNLIIPSGILCSLPIWNHIIPADHVDGGYFVLGCFIFGSYWIYRMFRYNCPHCGECPMSVSISGDGSSFNYNKGVALFPKRCTKCGYYLSKRALEADLEKFASKQSE